MSRLVDAQGKLGLHRKTGDQHSSGFEVGLDLRHRNLDGLPLANDCDRVAEPLHLGEDVAREQHRTPPALISSTQF